MEFGKATLRFNEDLYQDLNSYGNEGWELLRAAASFMPEKNLQCLFLLTEEKWKYSIARIANPTSPKEESIEDRLIKTIEAGWILVHESNAIGGGEFYSDFIFKRKIS